MPNKISFVLLCIALLIFPPMITYNVIVDFKKLLCDTYSALWYICNTFLANLALFIYFVPSFWIKILPHKSYHLKETSLSLQDMPTPTTTLHQSAQLFLDRVDQLEEVSTRHPIFLTTDPDDHPHDGSEAPLRRCCFTTIPNPIITLDSHKAAIRRLAQKNQSLIKALPHQLKAISFLKPFIPAIGRLAIQLARPFLLLFFFFKTLQYIYILLSNSGMTSIATAATTTLKITDQYHNNYNYPTKTILEMITTNPNDPTLWFTFHFVAFTFFAYSVYFDEMLLRDFFGWTTEVKSGYYYNKNDPLMAEVAKNKYFDGETYRYDKLRTPWLFSGDLRTAIPFALFSAPEIDYHRRWVTNEDGEAIAFDISFPTRLNETTQELELYHDEKKILHVALFGLNGGSNEPYILDFANRVNAIGHTCVVLITRGFMGTPIVNGKFFDGSKPAIESDLYRLIQALHCALGNSVRDDIIPPGYIPGSLAQRELQEQIKQIKPFNFKDVFKHDVMHRQEAFENNNWWTTPICVHGWSMGGVCLGKYVVSAGKRSGLLSAVLLAGSADAVRNVHYEYSKKYWQGFLTIAALINILIPQQHLLSPIGDAKKNINIDEIQNIATIVDFDRVFSINYHGYKDIEHYYARLSYARDPLFHQLDVPTLVMHADDDPVISVDTLKPAIDAIVGNHIQNLFVIVTRGGGHLGFPITNSPLSARWQYPMECTCNFSEEIARLQSQQRHNE